MVYILSARREPSQVLKMDKYLRVAEVVMVNLDFTKQHREMHQRQKSEDLQVVGDSVCASRFVIDMPKAACMCYGQ